MSSQNLGDKLERDAREIGVLEPTQELAGAVLAQRGLHPVLGLVPFLDLLSPQVALLIVGPTVMVCDLSPTRRLTRLRSEHDLCDLGGASKIRKGWFYWRIKLPLERVFVHRREAGSIFEPFTRP